MPRPWRWLAILSVVGVFAAACGEGDPGAVPGQDVTEEPAATEEEDEAAEVPEELADEEPIVLGLGQPLTGPVSAAGIAVRDGALIALDEINEGGGVHDRPLQLVIEDTENDPATCTSVGNRFVTNPEIVGLIGGWGSSCTLAIAPVATRSDMPLLVETSSSWKITHPDESGSEWIFRLSPPTRMEVRAVEDHLAELGFENVFFLSVNNDWGRGSVEDFTPAIEAAGGEMLGAEYFEQDEVDFSPVLTGAQGSGADSVIITTDAAQIALILEQMQALGIEGLNVLTSGGSNFPDKIMELAGEEAMEGVYSTVFFPGVYDPSVAAAPEKVEYFLDQWESRGHEWIEIAEGGRGYDAVHTYAAALELVDPELLADVTDETRAAVRDALAEVELDGAMYGHISFGDWEDLNNEHQPPIFIGQTNSGELEFVIEG